MSVTVTVSSGDFVIETHTLSVNTDTGEATISHRSGGSTTFENVRDAKDWLLGLVRTDITYGRRIGS